MGRVNMILAEEMVASGGPSAPVWAFLTAISLGILTLIGQQIASRKVAREATVQATNAAQSADEAQKNTIPVANGFVNRMDKNFERQGHQLDEISNALREHLEWHLNKETPK